MNELYYIYERDGGLFAGSGVTFYDDEIFASTTIPTPEFNTETEMVYFVNGVWEIRSTVPPVIPEEPVEPEPEEPLEGQ